MKLSGCKRDTLLRNKCYIRFRLLARESDAAGPLGSGVGLFSDVNSCADDVISSHGQDKFSIVGQFS